MKSVFLIPLAMIAFIGSVAFYGAFSVATANVVPPPVQHCDTSSFSLPLSIAAVSR